MWDMKKETIPVVRGTLGLIKKGMDTNINKIRGQPDINELQNIVLLGTSHNLRKTMSIK